MVNRFKLLLAGTALLLAGCGTPPPPIHRDAGGQAANLSESDHIHKGAVRSPHAPDKPPVGVRGLAYGTAVQCPYTGRTFIVPEPYRSIGLTHEQWVNRNLPADQRPPDSDGHDKVEGLYIPKPSTLRP